MIFDTVAHPFLHHACFQNICWTASKEKVISSTIPSSTRYFVPDVMKEGEGGNQWREQQVNCTKPIFICNGTKQWKTKSVRCSSTLVGGKKNTLLAKCILCKDFNTCSSCLLLFGRNSHIHPITFLLPLGQ